MTSELPKTPAAAPSPDLGGVALEEGRRAQQLTLAMISLVGVTFLAFGFYVAHRALFGFWPDQY